MTVLIGELSSTPKACGAEHLPGGVSAARQTWEGDRGSWHSRTLYDSLGRGAQITGYDVYFLPGGAS